MIKIVGVKPVKDHVLNLEFSDGSCGDYDLAPLIARGTSLTSMLADGVYFRRFFLEFGALSWPNGLELAPSAIHRQLKDRGELKPPARVA
jgi:hypothetical protein